MGPGGFEVVPAVDVLGDDAVRLLHGDYEEVTLREPAPLAVVERFVEAGAETVHLVDLSAARSGVIRPELVAQAVIAAAPASLQAAGGVRTVADAEALVAAGASRVVVGTAAFGAREILPELVSRLGERLVVAVDVKGGAIAVEGWTRATTLTVDEALSRLLEAGVSRVVCTAIEHDGALAGPALDLLAQVAAFGAPVLAAGGIRSLEDLAAVQAVGCEGAIVGRALLEGLVPLTALGTNGVPVESRG